MGDKLFETDMDTSILVGGDFQIRLVYDFITLLEILLQSTQSIVGAVYGYQFISLITFYKTWESVHVSNTDGVFTLVFTQR